jgi:hypothetical protein
MAYLDFDLLVQRGGDGYVARVLNSPGGQATARFVVPLSDLELENFYLRIGRPRRGLRRIDAPEMEVIKNVGARLYNALFEEEVRVCLSRSLDAALVEGDGLRIRLRLTEVPELADLPWEYLYSATVNRFVTLSEETPIVRYLDVSERIQPLHVDPPLRVLVMISGPSDYPSLDVEREWTLLNKALGELVQRNLVQLERLEHASLADLTRQLRRNKYHIFHFIGHGGFDSRTQDGVLVLEDDRGRGQWVSGQDVAMVLHGHRSLRLAVLNACEGARTSRTDPFAGVAQSLIQQSVPAVIAMQFEITDEAALVFAQEFYGALADGYPVDAAVAAARKMIYINVNHLEWGTPVLYMRSPDGRLFDIQPAESAAVVMPPVDVAEAPQVVLIDVMVPHLLQPESPNSEPETQIPMAPPSDVGATGATVPEPLPFESANSEPETQIIRVPPPDAVPTGVPAQQTLQPENSKRVEPVPQISMVPPASAPPRAGEAGQHGSLAAVPDEAPAVYTPTLGRAASVPTSAAARSRSYYALFFVLAVIVIGVVGLIFRKSREQAIMEAGKIERIKQRSKQIDERNIHSSSYGSQTSSNHSAQIDVSKTGDSVQTLHRNAKRSQDELGKDMYSAIQQHSIEKVSQLLAAGADINAPLSEIGFTPVTYATYLGFNDEGRLAAYLLNQGAQPRTDALIFAMDNNLPDLFTLLLNKGAPINYVVKDRDISPLHFAAEQGQASIVRLLISRGADVNIKNSKGQTPLAYASDSRRPADAACIQMLKNAGAQ